MPKGIVLIWLTESMSGARIILALARSPDKARSLPQTDQFSEA